ncbi:MAG TPA: FAD-dependent oxidoreductase [Burkholderiales bacterium]|nr:FAD-dependent oxidoreductase [Burkholderiales bacterium]
MAEITLLRREEVAAGTSAFYFRKPPGFSFDAGQNALFTLVDPPETDAQGPSRPFTIASAPHEPELMIATRMRDSAFKRVLKSAAPGLKLEMDGPAGVMVLHDEIARPAVFLAGGIGITPFLSMARHAATNALPHRIHLFYSNRRPEDAAFLDELRALEKSNPNYRLVATMAEAQKSSQPWRGETGFIRRDMLERHLPDLRAPVYYFAGPPGMAMAMQSMLTEIGISENDMRSEEFYGY